MTRRLFLGRSAACTSSVLLTSKVEPALGLAVHELLADFELTMGLAGCRSVAEISPESLVRAGG